MANPLTGDCEAVLQVSTRLINGLLAALHQNSVSDAAPLKLLHEGTVRHGDPPRRHDELADFTDWAVSYSDAGGASGPASVGPFLVGTAPPGAAIVMASVLTGAVAPNTGILEEPGPVIRGTARVQLASPTVTIPPASSAEIAVHVWVRAHYTPDAATTVLPAPIHGEVTATYDVRRLPTNTGGARLHIKASADDAKISFTPAPGSGLDVIEAARISAEVRKAVREGFVAPPVDLPPGFPFSEFKGLSAGGSQAIALPIALSPSPPPAAAVATVTNPFIGSSGFAFAVAKEAADRWIDLEGVRAGVGARSLTIPLRRWGFPIDVVYTLRFSQGPTLTWSNGAIEVSGRVEVETGSWWAPNGFVAFRQRLALRLDAASQVISLVAVGGPDVDESWFIPHDTAVGIVLTEMTDAVADAADPVRTTFADARTKLTDALRTFDAASSATYTAVAITPDGIVVRGEPSGSARRAPVIAITERDGGQTFSAQTSWIPGGRIERLIWSWVEHPGLTAWSGQAKSAVTEHGFLLPRPAGVTDAGNVCLRLEGTQIAAGGQASIIAGGGTCLVPGMPGVLEIPSWWEPVTVPVWLPDIGASAAMRLGIAGHVSVQTGVPIGGGVSPNTLVCFPEWSASQPLAPLAQALGQMRRAAGSILVTVVLPAGAFDATRRDIEAKLEVLTRARVRVVMTEDDEGGWSRTFGASRRPSVFLVNAKRQFVWKHEGEIVPATMAAALDRHVLPAPAPRFQPLRLRVAPGDPAPDSVFDDGRGDRVALHRLRGRKVVLSFWQPWSAPCLKELERLSRVADRSGPGEPRVVAVHGGAAAEALDRARKQYGESILFAHDVNQSIARVYGVRCWPTTVTIDEGGSVEGIRFGHSTAREPTGPAQTTDAS